VKISHTPFDYQAESYDSRAGFSTDICSAIAQKIIEKLQLEIQKLKLSRETDSKTSSLPPSTDLLQKSEKAKDSEDTASSEPKKRLHGGQPGHQGKTRQGFSFL